MATQLNSISLGAALLGADGRPKYRPNPRFDRKYDKEAVDKAFEVLKTFNWGSDLAEIQAIDDAVKMSHGDSAVRKELETKLDAVLKTDASRAAKDFTCRMLSEIGTAESVPALAPLLTDKDLSHMARFALARIKGPEAVKALQEALPKASAALKLGMIESLGSLEDGSSFDALAALSADSDKAIAFAAINALGKIGTPDAAKVLAELVKKAPDGLKLITAGAALGCAEKLTVEGKKAQAIPLYKGLSGEDQPKYIRLSATRGLLASAAKKDES